MTQSFSEVWGAVPPARRTNITKVAVGLLMLGALSPDTAVPVAKLQSLLKLKLRRGCPNNVADALRKAGPYVEPNSTEGRVLFWWLTASGVAHIEGLTKLQLHAAVPAAASYTIATLHPAIRAEAERLLHNHHYAEAVGRAAKKLNLLVRQRTNRTSDEGVRMMMTVFSATPNGQARLVLGRIEHEWERDRQEGFRFLMGGLQQGIANVDKHGHLHVPNGEAALEMLAFISFLARQVDNAIQVAS